jgi:hypothetical protein
MADHVLLLLRRLEVYHVWKNWSKGITLLPFPHGRRCMTIEWVLVIMILLLTVQVIFNITVTLTLINVIRTIHDQRYVPRDIYQGTDSEG